MKAASPQTAASRLKKVLRVRPTLLLIFALGLILCLSGCLAFHNETINVTNTSAWWGELHKDEILQTKQGAFLSLKTKEWIVTGAYGAGETVSVEDYKADRINIRIGLGSASC